MTRKPTADERDREIMAKAGAVTLNHPCPRCGYHDAALPQPGVVEALRENITCSVFLDPDGIVSRDAPVDSCECGACEAARSFDAALAAWRQS